MPARQPRIIVDPIAPTFDEHGAVDLQSQAPLSGTYSGADPMGLVWSMAPVAEGATPGGDGLGMLPPEPVTLTAELDGSLLAETTFERLRLPPHVQRTVVRDHGLVGTLFHPIEGGPHPGVLLIGGAEGGLHELDAALMAGHGFAVLALAYFGADGVPPHLVEIPLEYFGTAISFLQAHEQVQGDRLAMLGGSRGGEAALALAAATIPVERIQGAVLLVSAGDDRMWPCAPLSEIARERLERSRHGHPYRHLTYPRAGHAIAPPPYGSTTELSIPGPGVTFATGGRCLKMPQPDRTRGHKRCDFSTSIWRRNSAT